MQHSFDIMIAKKYGVQPAIILNHLYWWVEKNKANKVHFYDGYYWTYNSKSAFAEIFPYMNARQIDYALKKLIDNGLVITGNYNKSAYDRTLWYAITKMGYSILQNCEMEETKLQNGNNKNVKPIPNINTNINKDINNNNDKNGRDVEDIADYIYYLYNNNIVCSSIAKKDMVSIFKYYFSKFEQFYKKKHPYIKKEQLIELINTADYIETENNSAEDITINEYIAMIDRYFEIDTFDYTTDRNINHFWSVRANRYYEIM